VSAGQLILRPEAISDIESARDWYERKQAGLGQSFVRRVLAAFERVAATPEFYASVWQDVRFYRVKRFPFVVYYRTRGRDVEVLAVLRGSRDSGVWRSRV
jgi:plasmid stabilization system protein ParE